jgi:hypothetical protein
LIPSNPGNISRVLNLDLLLLRILHLNDLGRSTVRTIEKAHDVSPTERRNDESLP